MSASDSSDDDDLPSRILILYASETGNAQDIAERTGREIRRKGGRCTVQSMVEFDIVRSLFGALYSDLGLIVRQILRFLTSCSENSLILRCSS